MFPMLPALIFAASLASANNAQTLNWTTVDNAFEVLNLTAPDGSVNASFIPFGATLTNFYVKDKNGDILDLALGFDNKTEYATNRQFFGPIVGRYANRIANGTFTLPISKNVSESDNSTVYHVPTNENDGLDTLHGGETGYDLRVWQVLSQTNSSVVFGLIDPDGEQGFPGTVLTSVTYALKEGGVWKISMNAVATAETPIMLSGHHFWNLEGYKANDDLVNHYAQFNASQVIATDSILIPTGELIDVADTALDFREAKSIGGSLNDTEGFDYCGGDCVGFDNCWIYGEPATDETVFSIWSDISGVKLDVKTDQLALQIYSCNGIYDPEAPIARKQAHGGADLYYPQHSCLVIEQESWIDAINNPEWGIDQIYGPGKPYVWESTYTFSLVE